MVRFQILMAANMKMTAFWDIVPCSLVEVDRRFRGAYCLHHQGDEGPDDGGSTHQKAVIFEAVVAPMVVSGGV
jgi:hypothetical protein